MRVGMQTWGTEGDIRPFLALGSALSARGHDVELVYTSIEGRDFSALAAKCGVAAEAAGSEYFRANRERLAPRAQAAFELRNPLEQVRRIIEDLMDPVADVMLDAGDALAARCDVMVNHFLTYPAHTAAEKNGRPLAILAFVPMFASAYYTPIGMPSLGRLFNPLSWKVLSMVMASIFRDRVNHLRSRCELPPVRGNRAEAIEIAQLGLVAVSPALFERPADWPARAQLTGFLSLPEAAEPWEPEPALRAFLDGGPAPVFLSFGSMFNVGTASTAHVVRVLAEAVTLAGARGIIQAPDTATLGAPRARGVHYIARAPHAQLFPRCSLIVHHGGAGTTQSSLVAKRPSVVVPHAADQFYWGDLLHRRGVASKPLRASRLNAKRLAARIRYALERPALTERAAALGQALAVERGAERAADLIASMVTA